MREQYMRKTSEKELNKIETIYQMQNTGYKDAQGR